MTNQVTDCSLYLHQETAGWIPTSGAGDSLYTRGRGVVTACTLEGHGVVIMTACTLGGHGVVIAFTLGGGGIAVMTA